MGMLIAVAVALLAGVLLVAIAAMLVVKLSVIVVAMIVASAIGSLWLSAVIGAAAFFGIIQLFGQNHMGWALVGGLLTGAVVWVGMIWGISRKVLSVPQRWHRFVTRWK